MGQLVLINLMLRLIVCWVSLGLWCDSSFPLVLSQVGIQGVIWLQLDMLGPMASKQSSLGAFFVILCHCCCLWGVKHATQRYLLWGDCHSREFTIWPRTGP